MSKLPERNPQAGYIRPKENVGYIVAYDDGQERNLISAHGFHLESSDFSDLYLPALQFVDEGSNIHEMSINKEKQLLIDDVAVFNLSDFYTKKEVDELQVLKSPNGTKFKIGVHDDGTLYSQKFNLAVENTVERRSNGISTSLL